MICMISGTRLGVVAQVKNTGEAIKKQVNFNHIKTGSPLLLLFLLLLKRITFMFLFLKIHILMEKEQSILAKQPSARKTRGSLCFTEQQAFKAGCETF